MTVVWSATVPETHRVGGTMRTELEQLEAHFVGLRASGEGYLEVKPPTEKLPGIGRSSTTSQTLTRTRSRSFWWVMGASHHTARSTCLSWTRTRCSPVTS